MTNEELEAELISLKFSLAALEGKQKGFEENHSRLLDLQSAAAVKRLTESLRLACQLQSLKELLFEHSDKLGLKRSQIEAEFERRWKGRLDKSLKSLEEKSPNLAGSMDDRNEDEIPD